MKRATAMATTVLCVLLAGSPDARSRALGAAATRVPPPAKLPALVLPQPLQEVPPCDFAWAELVLEAARAYIPADLTVYQVLRSEPTKVTASELAARVGVAATSAQYEAMPDPSKSPEWCDVQVGDLHIALFLGGNYSLRWLSKLPNPGERQSDAVGAEETIEAAERLLASTGLLPEGAAFVGVVDGRVGYGDERHVWTRLAVFERSHDGVPEGRFVVEVNGSGEVCAVRRNMRNIRPLGRYPLIPVEEALTLLQSDAARVMGLRGDLDRHTAVVEQVSVRYYDGAPSYLLDTVQPIYVFEGTAFDSAGDGSPFFAYLPAVSGEYLLQPVLPLPSGTAVSPLPLGEHAKGPKQPD